MKRFLQYLSEALLHPKPDEFGQDFHIHSPDTHTDASSWLDSSRHATATPHGHEVPESLNGVKFASWSHSGHWNDVGGQGKFEEPQAGSVNATGAIIHEGDGRIWTLSPSNGFGGYKTTIGPKGRTEHGLNLRANAIKEAHEETGLKIRLTGHAHDVQRTTGVTRYYHAVREGGHPKDMGWEAQAVHLVPKGKLEDHLNHPTDKELARKLNAA